MKTYSKITPEGARDLLFEECRARREVQEKLSRVFGLRGYREVITPGLEYFDVFNLPGTAIPQQEMYKCTDNHGRLIVFRPDSTLPIARMAASRLQGHRKPLRFFYSQTIYRNRPDLSGRSDESAQMGIEPHGGRRLRADLEVIALAVEALSACAPDFRMEIGHARFFQVLADQLPLSAAAQEELRATIESKNYAALSSCWTPWGTCPRQGHGPAAPAVRRGGGPFPGGGVVPGWGGPGNFGIPERAVPGLGPAGAGGPAHGGLGPGAAQRLLHRRGVLCLRPPARGRGAHGRPVRQPVPELWGPHARRGLLPGFGRCGGSKRRSPGGGGPAQALVYGEPGCEMQAQKLAGSLANQGVLCEASVFESLEETLRYAQAAGIPKVLRVGAETEEILLSEGGKA